METKKNQKYDLEPKRPFFFGIGMIVALSLAITAFEWRTEVEPIITFEYEPEPFPIIVIPVTKDPEPPRPKLKKKPVRVVDSKNEIVRPAEKVPELEPIDPDSLVIEIPPMIIETPAEPPLNYAEVMPSYEGGIEEFYTFISKNIKYPRTAQIMGTEGKVFVKFIVERDGTLSDIHVIKGIGSGCDKEAVRVVSMANRFKPGKQGEVRVRVQMVVPISFKLY
ncbi:MAG: energy transducer TonB [Cyclobacteriaceae bacterium]